MAILPGYDLIDPLLTQGQIIFLATSQYTAMAVFFALFCITFYNFVQIIILQRRYKTLPLLAFYILSFMTIGMRIYTIIYFIPNVIKIHHYMDIAQPICKLQIGLVQAWIMAELIIRIDQSILQTKAIISQLLTSQDTARILSLDKRIECGRLIVFVMVFLNLIVLYLIMGFVFDASSPQFVLKGPSIIAYCFIAMFVLMGAVSYVLLQRMKMQSALEGNQTSSVLAPEQRHLMWTFGVFGTSYLARAIFDLFVIEPVLDQLSPENFKQRDYLYIVMLFFSYSLLDGLPLLILLLFHLKNFIRKLEIPKKQRVRTSITCEEATDSVLGDDVGSAQSQSSRVFLMLCDNRSSQVSLTSSSSVSIKDTKSRKQRGFSDYSSNGRDRLIVSVESQVSLKEHFSHSCDEPI